MCINWIVLYDDYGRPTVMLIVNDVKKSIKESYYIQYYIFSVHTKML